jgi:RNA polymerase sigma-70 factor (ECF subfamily)
LHQSEVDLVSRAKLRDLEAIEELYTQHRDSIFTYIFYRVGDPENAEDLTADVFVRMLSHLHRYKTGKRPLLAWLYTIARNLVVDHYRGNNEETLGQFEEKIAEDDESHPVKVFEKHMAQECLIRAMKYLTEEQQKVVILKFIERRENPEVAAILGKNERAIRSLQHRALVALSRALVKEQCYEDETR